TTAVIDEADVAYQLPNLPPKVTSIAMASAETDANAAAVTETEVESTASAPTSRGSGKQTITWVADDPNVDSLRYTISFRSGSRAAWVLLKDDLAESTYEWDTPTVPDGRYEVRVTASDTFANPAAQGKSAARVSDPILVDNTAPVLSDIKSETKGKDVLISTKAVDRTSALYSFEYSVDSSKDWQAVLPSDSICDGPEESVSFTLSGLKPGVHQVALRCTDASGNQALRAVTLTVEASAE
nr:hypothetical protein [Chthoniobacterales bacterium]